MLARLLLAGAVAAVLAAPANAQTVTPPPTISPLKRCYVSASPTQREAITIHAVNFMPLAPINIFIDNIPQPVPAGSAAPQADAAGTLDGTTTAPYQPTGQHVFQLRLEEPNRNNPAGPPDAVATANAKVTALEVGSTPAQPATTSSKVRFRGRGFTDLLSPIYAHYVLAGKARATVRIGKPRFDCGQFSVRRPQFPFKRPHVGVWTIQFDQVKTYNPQPPAFATLRVHVTRKP